MSKWVVPNPEEAEIIRSLGRNPDSCVVHRMGKDALSILDLPCRDPSKREIYVDLSRKKKERWELSGGAS